MEIFSRPLRKNTTRFLMVWIGGTGVERGLFFIVGYGIIFQVQTDKLKFMEERMQEYEYITLRQRPELKNQAAKWFYCKWGVPQEAYLECMESYLNIKTEYGWYLCLDKGRIIGGLGVIENDFHDRKDLTPNVCAVYTEEEYRCKSLFNISACADWRDRFFVLQGKKPQQS